MLTRYFHNDMQYVFTYDIDSDYITIKNYDTGVEKSIRVRDSADYRIQINKRTLNANGGARGAFCFLSDCIRQDFMLVYVNKVIENFNI